MKLKTLENGRCVVESRGPHVAHSAEDYAEAVRRLTRTLGRRPTTKEVAMDVGVAPASFSAMIYRHRSVFTTHLRGTGPRTGVTIGLKDE